MHQLREVRRVQHEEPGRDERAAGLRIAARRPVTQVSAPCPGVHAALLGAADLDVVGTDPAQQRDRTFEQDEEAAGRLAFLVDRARLV